MCCLFLHSRQILEKVNCRTPTAPFWSIYVFWFYLCKVIFIYKYDRLYNTKPNVLKRTNCVIKNESLKLYLQYSINVTWLPTKNSMCDDLKILTSEEIKIFKIAFLLLFMNNEAINCWSFNRQQFLDFVWFRKSTNISIGIFLKNEFWTRRPPPSLFIKKCPKNVSFIIKKYIYA